MRIIPFLRISIFLLLLSGCGRVLAQGGLTNTLKAGTSLVTQRALTDAPGRYIHFILEAIEKGMDEVKLPDTSGQGPPTCHLSYRYITAGTTFEFGVPSGGYLQSGVPSLILRVRWVSSFP